VLVLTEVTKRDIIPARVSSRVNTLVTQLVAWIKQELKTYEY